jgi:hypothetical protein
MKFDKKNILLWLSIGFVGGIIGRGIYYSVKNRGSKDLDQEMLDLIERIKKEPK